ncbi:glycosyltransferase family protein [Gaoshiqia sp. Z1-71]|uniref:glycosyltransferase family protein n=1 Tax=Gaoshiqia hydrogeniformans TaxID=3290090 RepID=UPI003BF8672C
MNNRNLRILYAIQGTGNGHLARATEIVPLLKQLARTDVLVSGIQGDIKLPFPVDYRLYGMSFIFGRKGGVSLLKTLYRLRPLRLIRDLAKLPVKQYDLVLCDFEPVSAWACRLKRKPCIGVSHQNAVLHAKAPLPDKKNSLGHFILKNYAPVSFKYGFHFTALDADNYSPVIRPAIRKAVPENKGHYTVYLPAYSNKEIEHILSAFPDTRWEVFSKHSPETYQQKNISFHPVSLEGFSKSFINCAGILCTAGFETPAEAIYMGKKLCVVPMKNQYEQACNAAFLKSMEITVLTDLRTGQNQIGRWLKEEDALQIDFPDDTAEILKKIISDRI